MRGTHVHDYRALCAPGIIPAYAGNTTLSNWMFQNPRDHPRVCGEHSVGVRAAYVHEGSSPRMRGTQRGLFGALVVDGIIPAYAGNTGLANSRAARVGDHPRVCGEHRAVMDVIIKAPGSSPRMRGTPCWRLVSVLVLGIIPAYAGNTPVPARLTFSRRDHPRVCGEHQVCQAHCRSPSGSSPRMRGTLDCDWFDGDVLGIIPAYAGNTCQSPCQNTSGRDHPRVCGEHALMASKMPVNAGSSPRMRGTRGANPRRTHRMGIIPAYAGNTPRL